MKLPDNWNPPKLGKEWKYSRHVSHSYFYKARLAQVMLYHNRVNENDIPTSWHVQAYFGKQHRRYGNIPKFIGSISYDSLAEATTVALALVKSKKARVIFQKEHEADMAKWRAQTAKDRTNKTSGRGN